MHPAAELNFPTNWLHVSTIYEYMFQHRYLNLNAKGSHRVDKSKLSKSIRLQTSTNRLCAFLI
jgi:hypothetical protein